MQLEKRQIEGFDQFFKFAMTNPDETLDVARFHGEQAWDGVWVIINVTVIQNIKYMCE